MSSPHMHILLLLMFAAVSRGIPSAESGGLQLNHSLSGIPGPSSGPNPSVIGSHDTQKAPLGVSWLRFDLVDPFTNASALLDIFMPHKLIATFTVLFFILLSAVIWYVLDKLDSRRPVVDQLSKLHRLHILIFGRLTHIQNRDRVNAYVMNTTYEPREPLQILERHGIFLRMVRFLLLNIWQVSRNDHTWIGLFYPPLEERVVALLIASQQNTFKQITIVAAITTAIVKSFSYPIAWMFGKSNTFTSHTVGKRWKNRSPSKLAAAFKRLYCCSRIHPVVAFHLEPMWAVRPRAEGTGSEKDSLLSPRMSQGVELPVMRSAAQSFSGPIPGLDGLVIDVPSPVAADDGYDTESSPLISPSPRGSRRSQYVRLHSDEPDAFSLTEDEDEAIVSKSWMWAVLSIAALVQLAMGLFLVAYGIYQLIMETKTHVASDCMLLLIGTLSAAAGLSAFVFVRISRQRLSILYVCLSFLVEVTGAIIVGVEGFSHWREILMTAGGVQSTLLVLGLLLIAKVLTSYRRSLEQQRRRVAALRKLKHSMRMWSLDPASSSLAKDACAVIVRAIRLHQATIARLRVLECRKWDSLADSRRFLRRCTYTFNFVSVAFLTYTNLVYVGVFDTSQNMNIFLGMLAVIIYDFLLFDPLLDAIEVGVHFLYNISHRDIATVLAEGLMRFAHQSTVVTAMYHAMALADSKRKATKSG